MTSLEPYTVTIENGVTIYNVISLPYPDTEESIIRKVKRLKDPLAIINFKDQAKITTIKLKNGKYHCDDGPAIVGDRQHKEWYQNGKLHREDGPAKISWKGDESWWKNGKKLEYNY